MSQAFGCRILTFEIKRALGSGDVILTGPKFGCRVRDNAKGFFLRDFFDVIRRRRIGSSKILFIRVPWGVMLIMYVMLTKKMGI